MSCRHDVGVFVFIGLAFLGWGVGLLVGHAGAGLFMGIGLGYIAVALLRRGTKERGAEVAPRLPPLPAGDRFGVVFLLGLGALLLVVGVEQLLGLTVVSWEKVGALFSGVGHQLSVVGSLGPES